MYEAIVTLVYMQSHGEPNTTYPVTEVHRIGFDTEQAMRDWLGTTTDDKYNDSGAVPVEMAQGVANVEKLTAEDKARKAADELTRLGQELNLPES